MHSNSLEPSQILVFLGPTLSVTQASQILPARYLAPVRCGDILACLRLQPRVIAIIDGFFDQSASVWHKEILWALEAGVRLFGASSMGALRATELEAFGMEGFGAIFAAYRDGRYIGDDEVAILHSNPESQFQPLTDALVNIRATVNLAVDKNIIDVAIANLIINCAKRQFFTQRHLRQAVADAEVRGGDRQVLAQFWDFVQNGGYVDQKQLDAVGLLKHLAAMVGESDRTAANNQVKFQLNKSIFIEELQARVAIRPLRTTYSWLPLSEKVSQEARFLGRVYIQLRNLAGLLRWCDAVAQQKNLQPSEADLADVYNSQILGLSSLNELELEPALLERLGRIQALLKLHSGHDAFAKQVEQLHEFILTIVDKDISFAKEENSAEQITVSTLASCERRLYRQVAILWALAEQTNSQSEASLRISITQKITQHFFQQRGVTNEAEFPAWLSSNSFTEAEFSQMMEAIARLEGFVNVPRWWGRGMSNYFSVSECFLPDALRLSGFYPILSKIVQSAEGTQSDPGEAELRNCRQMNAFPQECNITQVAFWLDFSEPEEFVKKLQTRL
ncbi:TfuA-like protein [Nostoc sp. 'Peltigera membranacea cyanobiont' N6]|uniref:TfuA-like protein n=1 Tax=Nostoc sp. 'Peltigera membranacea cyanobiont' N6 TaxID=1261031 RepID=UPI000CF362DD|nr:TfuA-like protein [Nostoc sp. 'Peltigera membranacea cyanobiont' N6]AVH67000.1 TfuA domain protein [Nostoc sp. 'Peltigera membranacea cyanobiont' N6]